MLRVIPFFILCFLVFGCSSAEKDAPTAQALFDRAREFEDDDRYEEAIRRYSEVRSKFPYSPQAVDAELAVADVYYKQESYPEAQAAYQSFRDLHPKHTKVPYVTFRYALSLYMQVPETIDRDLGIAPDAVLAFSELIKKFPQSEYVKESQEKRTELIKKLAEKEIYIGDFYYRKKMYKSSLGRYETAASEYLGLGFDEKILSRLVISAARSGNLVKARQYAKKLEAIGSLGSEGKDALREALK
jgi:outer membrane protein assembly factor BamD